MVNFVLDGKKVTATEGSTIMEACAQNNVFLPKLCYLKDINEIAACRVCVVEVEGLERLITSCNNAVQEGMVIYTNSPKVRRDRKRNVQLILSQHDCRCAVCVRSGNCALQALANDLNIIDIPYKTRFEDNTWNKSFPLIRDASKCIKCMRCIQICDKVQGLGVWDVAGTGGRTTVRVSGNRSIEAADCSLCGQCITHCPVAALRERDDTRSVWKAISDPDTVVVAQIAPAVRTSWGEELGLSGEEATVNKICDALKRMGVDYVFDTSFSADLTIMEEGSEFVKRFTEGKTKDHPMFTSCCPGWLRYAHMKYPDMVPYLSTAKSPQQMFGAVIKSYFAEKSGIDPKKIFSLSIMPCVSKKWEREMDLYYGEYAGHEVDAVLTTRELVRMIRAAHITPSTLEEEPFDSLMADYTGAGVIFGATGGVMEAALRSAAYLVTGENPAPDAFREVRCSREEGLTEATFTLKGEEVKIAVVNGLKNTGALLDRIRRGDVHYDFVEVMACPGGCAGGGGQSIHDGLELAGERGSLLYTLDENAKIRFSHENPDIQKLYEDYFEAPMSHRSHELLHVRAYAPVSEEE